jgi:oligoribonuclease NrnB/cAMP/cGMP phosphodiesterase (DHH superfamily)
MDILRNIKDELDCVIYHDPCQDGLSAAYVVYQFSKYHSRDLKLIPKKINNDPIDEKLYEDKNVLMVDIVTDDFEKIKEKAKNLVILDHHKTNQAKLEGINYAYFDMYKSGVGLAWEYFYGNEEMPKFLGCIQDRDIWTWKIPESKAFCDGFYNMMYLDEESDYDVRLNNKLAMYDELYNEYINKKSDKFNSYCQIGDILNKIKMSQVKSMVRNVDLYKVKITDHSELKAVFFNCTHDIASDLGNYAVDNTDVDFAVMWRYNHDDEQYCYSLRSTDKKADVSKICELFGGGGHRNAAGCASKLHPKDLFNYEKIEDSCDGE